VKKPAFAFLLSGAALFAAGLSAREAHADVSSWFYTGAGATSLHQPDQLAVLPFTIQTELGVGSPPNTAVIVGGIVKAYTFIGEGTDVAFMVRGASGGFVRGGLGLAIDAGFYERWWGGTGSAGFISSLALGGPFGLQITGMTEQGSNGVHSYGMTAGIDFLRLTVYRTTSQNYWPNPILPLGVNAAER
jgi:hypothetical protein